MSQRHWRPTGSHVTLPEPAAIAEPRHRVGVEGVSSAMSLRRLAPASLEQIKRICEHYVEKCSGKYERNVTAARYVYQMADEVLAQLEALEAHTRTDERVVESLQDLLAEWQRYFPVGGVSDNRPRVIYELLQSQQQELNELRRRLEDGIRAHADEVRQLQTVLDSHAAASRSSQLQDHERYATEIQELRGRHTQELANINQQHETETRRLLEEREKQLRDMRDSHTQGITVLENRYRVALQQEQHLRQQERDARVAETQQLQKHINELQEELRAIRSPGSSATQESRVRHSSTSTGTSANIPPGRTPAVGVGIGSRARVGADPFADRGTGTDAQLRELRSMVNKLQGELQEREGVCKQLQEELTASQTSLVTLRRRLSVLEDLNWDLRRALQAAMGSSAASVVIQPHVRPQEVHITNAGPSRGTAPVAPVVERRHPGFNGSNAERPGFLEMVQDARFWEQRSRGAEAVFEVIRA